MKNNFFFTLLILTVSITTNHAQDSITSPHVDKITIFPVYHELYLNKKGKERKKHIKPNATISYTLKEDSTTIKFARFYHFNSDGIFIAKVIISENINQQQKQKANFQLDSTISFIKFEELHKFGFRNYYREKVDANLLIGTTGFNFLVTPSLVSLYLGGLEDVFSKENLVMIGSGLVLISYSILRLVKIRKIKLRSLEEYQFVF